MISGIKQHQQAHGSHGLGSAMGSVSSHSDPKVHTDRLDDIQLIKAESGEGQQARGTIWVVPHSEMPANLPRFCRLHLPPYGHSFLNPSFEITNPNASL